MISSIGKRASVQSEIKEPKYTTGVPGKCRIENMD
jgi:hypothetical protein